MSGRFYYKNAGDLNRGLKQFLERETLKALHRKSPARHFAVAGRQLLLLLVCPILIYHFSTAWVWVPAAVLLGFTVFSFSVLLHEVVHKCIFNGPHPKAYRTLGLLYGTLSGLSSSQFTRWHLDHHNELGDAQADPKRAYLSPKRNRRWLKLLYCTPALYPIYFRAAAKANAGYPPQLQKKIKKERVLSIGFHLTCLGLFLYINPLFALKAYVVPVFFIFPIAFTLNRLGQHYVIDPADPAKWSTLVVANPVWNFLFLWSSYHLEHHYYPAVPFYNLKKLQKTLEPFYRRKNIPAFNYRQLLKLWFIDNHKPHAKWPETEAAGLAQTKTALSD